LHRDCFHSEFDFESGDGVGEGDAGRIDSHPFTVARRKGKKKGEREGKKNKRHDSSKTGSRDGK
jgi:hypothetical protein